MVALDIVKKHNIQTLGAGCFVAVVVGGTSGIGEATVRQLAATRSTEGKGLCVYIVGRNQAAADRIIADCSKKCPGGKFQFFQAADLALLRNVDKVCDSIIEAERGFGREQGRLARIDLLVACQGIISLGGREETSEGIDMTMSLFYYSRMRCIIRLLPLLTATDETSMTRRPPAHFVSVFNPKLEGKIVPEDLSVRDAGRPMSLRGSHGVYMTRFFFEALAARYPDQLAMSNLYPGFVRTDLVKTAKAPTVAKWAWRFIFDPLVMPFISVPLEEVGQRVIFLSSTDRFPARSESPSGKEKSGKTGEKGIDVATGSDGKVGSGAYRVNWDGEIVAENKEAARLRGNGLVEQVWAHTMKAFEDIEKSGHFTG